MSDLDLNEIEREARMLIESSVMLETEGPDFLEARVLPLVSALRESQAEVACLREAVAGWHHARVADDGMACWCLTEHAHRKYGCDDLRAALGQPAPAE